MELVPEKYVKKTKLHDITTLPPLEVELRIIVWKTIDLEIMDVEECNDVYVKVYPSN